MPKKTIVELSVATMTNTRTNARNQNDCIVSGKQIYFYRIDLTWISDYKVADQIAYGSE
jgi:hypothetical protein